MTDKVGDYVDKYLRLRDRKKQIQEQHKAELEPIDNALALLEKFFYEQMEKLGLDNLKTASGTAYTSKKYSVTSADSIAFLDFVKEHEAWHLIDARPAKSAVQEYVETHGVPPPGVNVTPIIDVNVRKS